MKIESSDICGCVVQEVNPEYCLSCESSTPTIEIRLISMVDCLELDNYKSKIYKEVQNQLQIPLKIVSTSFLGESHKLDDLYNGDNLNLAVKLAKENKFNGITIFIGESIGSLNGFSLPWLNTCFVDIKSDSKYSSTIAHEIGHDLGLNHTFTMTQEEKEMFDIKGDSEQFNLMNYATYTDHLTEKQITYIKNKAIEKYS